MYDADVYLLTAAIIEQARSEGQWLFMEYQNTWFSPDELEEKNAEGDYVWGHSLKIADPQEHLDELKYDVAYGIKILEEFKKRVSKSMLCMGCGHEQHRGKKCEFVHPGGIVNNYPRPCTCCYEGESI